MTWHASRDAVPDWHVQATVYDEATGERVATVFGSHANIAMVTAAPAMLDALRKLADMHRPLPDGHVTEEYRIAQRVIAEIEHESEVPA